MSTAIHYIDLSAAQSIEKNIDQCMEQKSTALHANVPAQAVHMPINEILDKATLLTSLAHAGDFPSYFSPNWDSAWDCLTDSAVTHLILNLTTVEKINTEDFNMFKSIIEDAYRDFGKPQLWVIVNSI